MPQGYIQPWQDGLLSQTGYWICNRAGDRDIGGKNMLSDIIILSCFLIFALGGTVVFWGGLR